MGSVIEKKWLDSFNKKSNKMVKTKGERLGWESLKNEKETPLREVVGEGRVASCCFMSVSQKIIL